MFNKNFFGDIWSKFVKLINTDLLTGEECKEYTCIICNNPINGLYCSFPKGNVCINCHKKYPPCSRCNIPVKDSTSIFQDEDFLLCSNCNKDKITRIEDLKQMYYKVKNYAQKSCGINASIKKAVLLPSAELKKRTKNTSNGNRALGFCETMYIISDTSQKQTHTIYLQNGMPYNLAFKTLAHEYGHAWDHQNTDLEVMKRTKDHAFSEGFAEWVSYYTAKEYGLKEETEEMKKRAKENCDPVYSTGLKKMIKLEKKLGSKQAVLEYVKNHNDF